jgi:DNA repair and recombination RAD54-like protein
MLTNTTRLPCRHSFTIPSIMAKNADSPVKHTLSHAALGCRRQPILLPRPLFDPMSDHAIVLYDPTIDDKPEPDPTSIEANLSPEELVKREEEEKVRRDKEDRERNGPHKSLKVILGLDKVVKKEDVKVPVVIDPRLTAKLRPHQVEGVKVSSVG